MGRRKTHGLTNHRLYQIWKSMIDKTQNENSKDFKYYGERGISVCERWRSVEFFIEDMYQSFEEGLQLDRIENDGNYEKSNCRWTTNKIQQRNKTNKQRNNTSGFKGVSWNIGCKKWMSKIKVDKKAICLGYFETPEEGAKAYDDYVILNNLEHTLNKSKI